MNLFEISKAYEEVIENGFHEDSETGEILFDEESLDELIGDFNSKVDNIVCYIKNLETLNTGIKKEIDSMSARKKANEKKIENLKSYIVSVLKSRDLKKYQTEKNAISIRKSALIKVTDFDSLDDKYKTAKTTYTPNKADIKIAILSGKTVDGAKIEEKENLQIK